MKVSVLTLRKIHVMSIDTELTHSIVTIPHNKAKIAERSGFRRITEWRFIFLNDST